MNEAKNEGKPLIIGIPGWKVGDNSFGCGTNHLDYISTFGIPRILFPQDDDIDLDMLYLPGGPDVSPSSYGAYPGFYTGNPDLFRQHFFDVVLPKYITKGTPIFGVCLGMQMLNIKFGGTLTQNLHHHAQSDKRWEAGHKLYFVGESRKTSVEVNSHHHQAVLFTNLSEKLEPLAYADNEEDRNNGIVEAFIHKELPIAGVQWHPEEWRDHFAKELIETILKRKQDESSNK